MSAIKRSLWGLHPGKRRLGQRDAVRRLYGQHDGQQHGLHVAHHDRRCKQRHGGAFRQRGERLRQLCKGDDGTTDRYYPDGTVERISDAYK